MKLPESRGPNFRQASTVKPVNSGDFASSVVGKVMNYKKQKDHNDLISAQNKKNKLLNQWKEENLQRSGSEALGITMEYKNRVREIDEEISSSLSGNAQANYLNWSDRENSNAQLSMAQFENKNFLQVKKNNHTEAISNLFDSVRLDPSSTSKAYQDLEEQVALGVGSGVIDKSEASEYFANQKSKLRKFGANSWYDSDKHEMIKNIDSFGFGEGEKQSWLDKYNRDLKAEERIRKSQFSGMRADILNNKDGMRAIALETGDTTPFQEAIDNLNEMGFKQDAISLNKEKKLYDKARESNKNLEGLSLAEKARKISAMKVGEDVEEAGSNLKVRDLLSNRVKTEISNFKKDPAQFVESRVTGNTLEEKTRSSLRLQQEQGVPLKGGGRILTDSQKLQISETFKTANSSDRVRVIDELQAYGEFTTKTYQELGLPRSMGMYKYLGDSVEKELFINSAVEKPKLKPGESIADYRDISNIPLVRVLEKAGSYQPGNQFRNTVDSINETLINYNVNRNDPGASRKMLEEKFDIIDEDSVSAFIPKYLDEDEVEDALEVRMQEIKKEKLELLQASEDGSDAIFISNALEEDSIWINGNDGLILISKKTGKAIPGEKSFIPFTELGHGNVERGIINVTSN